MNWFKNGWLVLSLSLGGVPAIEAGVWSNSTTWIKDKTRKSTSYIKNKCSQLARKINLAPEDYLLILGAVCFAAMLYADTAAPQECGICFDDKSGFEFTRLACGHSYCTDCLKRLVQTGLNDKNTHNLLCPNTGCRHKISRYNILSISGYFSDNYAEFNKLAHQEYILGQPDGKQCPTPDCEYLFLAGNRAHKTRCRLCRNSYCSHCLHDHTHRITCQEAEEFRDLKPDEEASEVWKLENSKRCPNNCGAYIQKNGGCNKVLCTRCRQSFCWLCLQPNVVGYNHFQNRGCMLDA